MRQQMPIDRLFYASLSADSNSGGVSKLSKMLAKADTFGKN
jgi:hypothetical protein